MIKTILISLLALSIASCASRALTQKDPTFCNNLVSIYNPDLTSMIRNLGFCFNSGMIDDLQLPKQIDPDQCEAPENHSLVTAEWLERAAEQLIICEETLGRTS